MEQKHRLNIPVHERIPASYTSVENQLRYDGGSVGLLVAICSTHTLTPSQEENVHLQLSYLCPITMEYRHVNAGGAKRAQYI